MAGGELCEGPVEPVSAEEADAYFASRPRGSQIASSASEQSRPVQSRSALLARVAADVQGDEPVLVVTQASNQKALALAARLGFVGSGEFTEFGSAQHMLTASIRSFSA